MENKIKSFLVKNPSRVDIACSESLDISRSNATKYIKQGLLKINKKTIKKPSFIVNANDFIELAMPDPINIENIKAENIPINIIYQDADILAINKQSGMVVHPANGHYSGTLVNALLYHIKDLSGINGIIRPGIVHRLDKDTSGILLVAKNDNAHISLANMIKNREIKKYYIALVSGVVKDTVGTIIKPISRDKIDRKKMCICIEGRYAETHYQTILGNNTSTLLLIRIITGRTHQIRVHMNSIHHSVLGDNIYSNKSKMATRLMLHAYNLQFYHPMTNTPCNLLASIPSDFIQNTEKYGYKKDRIIEAINNLKYLI